MDSRAIKKSIIIAGGMVLIIGTCLVVYNKMFHKYTTKEVTHYLAGDNYKWWLMKDRSFRRAGAPPVLVFRYINRDLSSYDLIISPDYDTSQIEDWFPCSHNYQKIKGVETFWRDHKEHQFTHFYNPEKGKTIGVFWKDNYWITDFQEHGLLFFNFEEQTITTYNYKQNYEYPAFSGFISALYKLVYISDSMFCVEYLPPPPKKTNEKYAYFDKIAFPSSTNEKKEYVVIDTFIRCPDSLIPPMYRNEDSLFYFTSFESNLYNRKYRF